MTPPPDEISILGIGLVGSGFSFRSFQRGLAMQPHVIASDGGSSDVGPYFLGSGVMEEAAIARDLETLIQGARSIGVPLIVGSIGTAGGDTQVDTAGRIVRDIARKHGLHFRLALIRAGQDKAYLQRKLSEGKIVPLGPVAPLTARDIDDSAHIVGMMGVEPFIDALEQGADVIIAGRAADPAIFAGPALRAGFDAGLAWHAARTIDKGPLMTEPVQAGSCVLATIRRDHFVVRPTHESAICSPRTVSSISIYESDDPFRSVFPSGTLETTDCRFEVIDDRSVRVTGARFLPADRYTVKLEGARKVGYRSMMIMGIRDPALIADFDVFIGTVRQVAERNLALRGIAPDSYTIRFRAYGRDGVMGEHEPRRRHPVHELGVVLEGVAADQATASAAVRRHFSVALHAEFKGRLTTAGNIANPFSGPPIQAGAVYDWSVWHVVETGGWQEACSMELVDF